ncbi:two-component regulator propeller domain-containing protein [Marivirga harenae]|uniref:two-component regulator propeller domain-containing protein n=1 Tax=Marivirga harenae TaxID=2010992 RepID=UPI0026DFE3DD|nr:two-component regulator propeller domain-containing protein [Marivirga harenae]WKV11316.1 two-component regulator propeller domain-containing protein [Marivirga harenae]
MKKYFCLGLIILLSFQILNGQNFPIEFRHLDRNMGLDQPFPYSIIQDQDGFIWIGGENGLWKYSGSEFKHYYHNVQDSNSLTYDFVWTLFADSKGNIWAGTYGGGLSKFNPQLDQFTNYVHSNDNDNSISDNKVRGIAEDSHGNIWIGTNNGLNKLDPASGQFKHYGIDEGLADLTVRTIKQSLDKKKLFIATARGVNIFDIENEDFSLIGKESNTKKGLRHPYIYDLLETDDGKLWVATGNGVDVVNLETMRIDQIPNNVKNRNGLSHEVCFSIYENPQKPGKIWFGTMNGINFYDRENQTFHWVNAKQKNEGNIGGNNIYNIFEDNMGGLWSAVNNGGVYYSHPLFNKFQLISFLPKVTDKFLNRYTSFIRHDENELLITTYSGLIVKNEKTKDYNIYKLKNGDPSTDNRLTQITRWKENEYLISVWGNSVYHWDHKNKKLSRFKKYSQDSNLNFNLRIFVDHKKRIWLGNSLKGLFRYNLQKEELKPFPVSDLSLVENSGDEYVKFIFEDQNNRLWVGTAGGLHLYDEKTSTFIKFESSPREGFLSNGNINHISQSNKNGLWISTELGLNFFNFTDSSFTRYFKNDGLPSNVISSTLEDENGDVWIATASGLSKMSSDGKFSNYNQNDGLKEEYFIFGSAFKDPDGTLKFGSSREMVQFNPSQIQYNKVPPKVYFSQLKINNKLINSKVRPDILTKSISHTKSIILKPEDILININFDALNLINGHKNMYALFMEGLDESWRPASTKKSVTFSNLKPGEYILRLKALNDENIWSKEEATLAITVLPFWYKSVWFRTLLSISILLFVGLILRWRFNQIKNRNKILEDLVRNRTEEVRSQKEEIESQNEKLHFRNERIELLLRELNHRIKNNLQLISSILNLHSRSTSNLDAKMALTEGKLRMQSLSLLHQKLYMTEKYTEVDCKEYIKELIDYLSMAFKSNYSDVHFNLDIDEFKLNLDQAVPLGLILNEIVTNSLKHSGEDQLVIDFTAKKHHDRIIINLKDNGTGISKSQFENSNSFGLSIIKSLIDQLDGEITVGCEDGNHFKISFTSK